MIRSNNQTIGVGESFISRRYHGSSDWKKNAI